MKSIDSAAILNKIKLGRRRVSVVVMVTHATQLYGPPNALADYINAAKVAHFVFVKHPLDIGLNRNREVLVYKKGVLVSHQKERESKNGVTQFIKDILFTRRLLRKLSRELGTVDLYVGANPLNMLAGILSLPKRKIRNWVFYSVDYSPVRFKNKLLNYIYRFIDDWAARYADSTFSVTKRAIKERVKSGANANKMIYAPNGVDNNIADGPKSKIPTVIYVGTLGKEKGIQDVLNNWQKVVAEIKNAQLEIVGSGVAQSELERLVRKLNIAKNVTFLGQLEHSQTMERIKKAWAGIALYNRNDSYTQYCDPMKVREYIAAGAIPIVSDVPEIAEVVKEERAGEVISSTNEIAQTIIKVLNKPTAYQAGLKKMRLGSEWFSVFNSAFKKAKLKLVERPWRSIMAALWNPGEKEIAAGGFRRSFEILKRMQPEDGLLFAVDAEPSIMSQAARENQIIVTYKIPKLLKRLEKVNYNLERILEWLYSMTKITIIGYRLRHYYDVVFVPFSEIIVTSFGAGPLKWLARRRVVFCNENTDPKFLTRVLNRWYHNHVDRSFTISLDLAEGLYKDGFKGPMAINYTGLDVSLLKQIPRQEKKYDAVFIGRHAESKGIFDYVKMLPVIKKSYPNFKFISVGMVSPDIKQQLISELTKLGVADMWQFIGVVTEKEKYKIIKQSKMVWFLSTLEGWGIVPQEALACEVIPICYDIPVYKESIRPCNSVIFVEPNDWKSAAKEVLRFMKMPTKQKEELERKGAEFVEQFDWERVAKRELDIINGVELGQTPPEELNLLA